MWDDVIIGKGEKRNSATIVTINGDITHGISQNDISYWITDCILGLGCKIYKDTKEGQKLQAMIEKGEKFPKIQSHIDRALLKRINSTKLRTAIKSAEKRAYDRGKDDKAYEIKECLGIESY